MKERPEEPAQCFGRDNTAADSIMDSALSSNSIAVHHNTSALASLSLVTLASWLEHSVFLVCTC